MENNSEHFQCRQWMQVAEHQAKQDEALLRECYLAVNGVRFPELFEKLVARLAPSVSEGKGGPGKCVCGEPSPDRLVIHRTDGQCYLRPREPQ